MTHDGSHKKHDCESFRSVNAYRTWNRINLTVFNDDYGPTCNGAYLVYSLGNSIRNPFISSYCSCNLKLCRPYERFSVTLEVNNDSKINEVPFQLKYSYADRDPRWSKTNAPNDYGATFHR